MTKKEKLFAGVGGFQVAAGGVGLGLVATSGGGELVLLDGFVAVVEEVEHFARVELSAAADPIAAGGLRGGEEVVLCRAGDVVLAALGVGEAEAGHVQPRLGRGAGLFCVFESFR